MACTNRNVVDANCIYNDAGQHELADEDMVLAYA